VLEEGTRPEYIIPVGSADGVWGMMKRVGRFRSEGWLALWKGALRKIYARKTLKLDYRPANVVCNGGVIKYTSAYDQRISAIVIVPIDVPIPPTAHHSSSGITPNNRIPAFTAGPG
jgi:hypothetical protein